MAEFVYQMYKARKAVGEKVILDDVTVGVYPGAKIGVVGPNGMGKSTLLNAIAPELQLATGEISEKLGRGKHTTRQVQLYPCAGGYLADTPGFSTFEVEQYLQMDKDCIADCFPEFRPYLGQCRFSDCAHVCEKGCAVVEAVRAGKIAKSRHDAYVSLYQTAKQRKAWES